MIKIETIGDYTIGTTDKLDMENNGFCSMKQRQNPRKQIVFWNSRGGRIVLFDPKDNYYIEKAIKGGVRADQTQAVAEELRTHFNSLISSCVNNS